MKKALIHDWFVTYGGAEKCIESITNIWNDFDIFSLIDFLDDNDRKLILKDKKAKTSFVQKLPFAKSNYRNYLPFFPYAIEQFDLSNYDLIISSSHAVAKGVLTNSNQLHISYVHTPIRYVWDLYFQYLHESDLDNGIKGFFAKYFLYKIRQWDISTANRPDFYIANSNYTAKRIKKVYNKEASVIHPPVDTNLFNTANKSENYYITVSRMVSYKKIDLIVEAFSKTNHKLLVIGDGPDLNKIRNKANKNIELLGYLSFETMKKYLQNSKAFIFAAEEDFGIAPVEAQACGIPVISFGKGGVCETVIGNFCEQQKIEKNHTGIFFREQTVESLLNAVNLFEKNIDKFDKQIIKSQAERFNRKIFEEKFKNKVEELINVWKNKLI